MECIKSYNWSQTFCIIKTCPLYESTCWLVNLMKNQIIQKFQCLEILKEKAVKQKTMGSKCLALGSNHMCAQEIILPKTMFGCPLKLILGILGFFTFLVINQNYIQPQLCMHVQITTITWIILNWTIQFFSFNFF